MKILTVIGARPQFIKASVVSAALRKHPSVTERVVHTGQHFDENMSRVFFDELGMKAPDVNLGINGGSHGEMTGRMLAGLESVLLSDRPDVVLVYGDTNSTLAGGLAAAKLHIPVAHVEAGLRSFNRAMPEEINRVLTDHLSMWLFAPTAGAAQQLQAEGIPADIVHQVGDVMYDVAVHFGKRAEQGAANLLDSIGVRDKPYVLATVHRERNTDDADRLRVIVQAIKAIAAEITVVWPVHPRTRAAMQKNGIDPTASQLILIEPQGYLGMVALERGAAVVVTDSGGVQKEAYFYSVPCVTLREETEWTELVELGWNRLAPPTSPERIRDTVMSAIGTSGRPGTPYGNGDAAEQIANTLQSALT